MCLMKCINVSSTMGWKRLLKMIHLKPTEKLY
jgi:hypothetical protein